MVRKRKACCDDCETVVVALTRFTAPIITHTAFRMQEMGFRDVYEYIGKYGEPEVWDNGLYSKLQSKETGFFTYW